MLRAALDSLLDLPLGRRRPRRPAGELGLLEHWYAVQTEPRVPAVVLEFAEPIELRALETALRAVQARHPRALAATLELSSASAPQLRPLAQRALPLRAGGAAGLFELAEAALHAPFEPGGLLWRVHVTSDRRRLVASFHHAIADGLSTYVFARDLSTALRGQPCAHASDEGGPLDDRLDLRPSLRVLREELGPRRRGAQAPYLGPCDDAGPLRTALYPTRVAAPVVAALARAAQREHTTVQGAVSAAGLLAAAHHAGRPRVVARLLTPISLRQLAEPRPEGMGNFLCAAETDHALDADTEFWSLARECRQAVQRALPDAYRKLGLLALVDVAALARRAALVQPNGRAATVEVSNLGRQPGLGRGRRLWFCQGNHYHGALFCLSLVTCADQGELGITLAVPSPLVSASEAEGYLRLVDDALQRAAAEHRPSAVAGV